MSLSSQAQDEVDASMLSLNLESSPETIASRRQQNALAPISQLPVELMRRFMAQVCILTSYDSTDAKTSDQLSLCHVTHAWRQIALGGTELWKDIHAVPTTPAPSIELWWSNSGDALVDLRVETEIFTPATVPGIDIMATKIKLHPNRFKSIWLHGRTINARDLFDLLGESTLFERLEILHIRHYDEPWDGDRLASCTAPNLCSVTIQGCNIPWRSPLLRSASPVFAPFVKRQSPSATTD